jgi:hypothetical protein
MSLDERGLADTTVANEHELEFGSCCSRFHFVFYTKIESVFVL